MNVNSCHEIDDASAETFRVLADLIEVSRTDEQMVYREAELDELWRWIDTDRAAAEGAEAARLAAVLEAIVAVHDMLEDVAAGPAAAERLRSLAPAEAGHAA